MFHAIVACCFILVRNVITLETEVVVLRAVKGRDARLPCGQGKVFLDGPDAYVLWLKNDKDFLYRFPNEDSDRSAVNINRDHVYGMSCDAGACHDDTSLLLKRVGERDVGTYRCRVHYQASPSVDYVIDVRLVDSPGNPKIYNGDGDEIHQPFIGPLSLGSNFTLICEVDDGKITLRLEQPDTVVYWRRNGEVIERAHVARPHVLRAEVHVRNATRSELNAHYECLAQNADVTDPLTASVVVKMFLPPLSMEIRLNNNVDFEAGQPRVVDCVVVGCLPPPTVTWYLGDTVLRPTVHKELHDGNFTVSSLTLALSLRDNGKALVCRAHNSLLPAVIFEDKVTLNVGFRPVCLETREETIGAVVQELETVTCTVDSSPAPLQFSWTFADSRTAYTSVQKVPGNHHRYSSTLTWLPRESDFGPLYCRATNAFGEQKHPCAYTLARGGAPAMPECVVVRAYPDLLRVQCKKGWDGGRLQTIHLELRDVDCTLIHNSSEPGGHFHLPKLAVGRNLTAVVYASNLRGKSEARTLYLQPLKPMTASAVLSIRPTWPHWLEGIAVTLAIGVVVSAIALCYRVIKSRDDENDVSPDLVPQIDGMALRSAPERPKPTRRLMPVPIPDLIPRTNMEASIVNQTSFKTESSEQPTSPSISSLHAKINTRPRPQCRRAACLLVVHTYPPHRRMPVQPSNIPFSSKLINEL